MNAPRTANGADVRAAAQQYIDAGLQVVPLKPGDKACFEAEWKTLNFVPDDFRDGDNIGIKNGDGTIDVDLDCIEACRIAPRVFTVDTARYGRASKPNSHWVYRGHLDKPEVFKDLVTNTNLLELRIDHQSMAPPSIHPDGEPVEWSTSLRFSDRPDGVTVEGAIVASAAELSRYYPSPGGRHHWMLGVAGDLRNCGVPAATAEQIVREAAHDAGDEKVDDRLIEVRTTYAKKPGDYAGIAAQPDVMEAMEANAPLDKDGKPFTQIGRKFIQSLKRIWRAERAGTQPEDHEALVEKLANLERARRAAKRIVDAEERPAVDVVPLTSLEALLAAPEEQAQYRIGDLLPRNGRAVFAAQFKAGKTTAIGNLCKSLVDGCPFLGKFAVTAFEGNVGVVDFEMSQGQLAQWYRDMQFAHPERVKVAALRGQASGFDIINPEVRSQWADRLRQQGIAFLVVDCLRPIMDALGLNEHTEAGKFLQALDALLTEAGIGECVLVHHMGHANERGRGDSRIRDWPDAEWKLVRQTDDPSSTRFFSAIGRDVEVPEQELHFNPATRVLTICGGSRKDAKLRDESVGPVLQFLAEAAKPVSQAAVIKGAGLSRKSAVEALRLADRDGLLTVDQGPRGALLYSLREGASNAQPSLGM